MTRKLLFAAIVSILCLNVWAQDTLELSNGEAKIAALFEKCFNTSNDSLKTELADQITEEFRDILGFSAAFDFKFHSLKPISSLYSENGKVRLITYGIALTGGTYVYHGFVMYNEDDDVTITELCDRKNDKPETSDMQASNWYGAIYYEIKQYGSKKDPIYGLCGWDGANMFSNRKILEQMQVRDGKPVFGGTFDTEKRQGLRRLVFEYSEKATMSLRYDSKLKMVVADHLAAPQENLYRGNAKFKGPDLSYDGYLYKDGRWNYIEDVDAKIQ